MNVKRTLVSIITAAFIAISIFVFFTAFKIKEVDATFTTIQGSQRVEGVQTYLNEMVGDNLLFLKRAEVQQEIEKDPYFKVENVKKSFPNVLTLSVKERREVFSVFYNNTYFVVAEDGVVLRSLAEKPTNLIEITLADSLQFTNVVVGSNLSCTESNRLYMALALTESVRLNDCVNQLYLSKSDAGAEIGVFQTNVTYGLITGGSIEILNVENLGKEKAETSMQAFDNETSDYVKSSGKIQAGDLVNGDYYVVWVN